MAIPDDYKLRTMAVLCQEALEFLRGRDGNPYSCAQIGYELFGGDGSFALIAGKVMKRLKDAGLVTLDLGHGRWSGWIVTDMGRTRDYEEKP